MQYIAIHHLLLCGPASHWAVPPVQVGKSRVHRGPSLGHARGLISTPDAPAS